MIPLRERVVAALTLQPMTKRELARSCNCSFSRVEQLVCQMRVSRRVAIVGKVPGRTRPQWLFGARP